MMKLIDNIINKFGSDKILHFLVGGYLTCLFGLFGWVSLIIGFIITFILEFIKEKFLDNVFDKKDFIATMLGSILSIIVFLISMLV